MRNFLSKFFLIGGCLLILAAAGLAGYNFWDSWRAGQEADSLSASLEAQMDTSGTGWTDANGDGLDDGTGYPITDEEKYGTKLYELYPEMAMPTAEIDGYDYIGILEVPSLSLKMPVMEEWDYTRLRKAPCRYSGSVYTKDITIAGHNYMRLFGSLRKLKGGENVYFTDMSGNRFEYIVTSVEVLDPSDVEEMTGKQETDDWDMTLFTCTVGAQFRYAIRCTME